MLPGTCHCQGHLYHPSVPLGQLEATDFTGFLSGSTP
jgi:hypothetical protein